MRRWDRAREASLETVTCSWNVCGVMRTERQEGTCRADTRSRHADSGLFMLFVIVGAKMGGRDPPPRAPRPPSIYLNVFYDVMMTLPAAAKQSNPTHHLIVKKIHVQGCQKKLQIEKNRVKKTPTTHPSM